MGSDQHNGYKKDLRFLFVAFLFSFAVREIAVGAFKLLEHQQCRDGDQACWPGLAQLVLTLAVILYSWVGWARNSVDSAELRNCFSLPFLTLVSDVLLVMLYIALADSAEPMLEPRSTGSAYPEAIVMVIVYALYSVWDYVHDVRPVYLNLDRSDKGTLKWHLYCIALRCWCSVVSFLVAFFVAYLSRANRGDEPVAIALLDGVLLFNVVLFRSLKVFEPKLDERMSVPREWRDNPAKYDGIQGRMIWGVWLSVVAIIIMLGFYIATPSLEYPAMTYGGLGLELSIHPDAFPSSTR